MTLTKHVDSDVGVGESFTMTNETHKDMDDLDGFWYKHHVGHNPSNFIPKDTKNVWLKRSLMNIEERGH